MELNSNATQMELNYNVRSSIANYQNSLYKPSTGDIHIDFAGRRENNVGDTPSQLEGSVHDLNPTNVPENAMRIDLIRAKRKIELLEKKVQEIEEEQNDLKRSVKKNGTNIASAEKLDEVMVEQNRQKNKIEELDRYQKNQACKISLLKRFNEFEKNNSRLYSPVSNKIYNKSVSPDQYKQDKEDNYKHISKKSKNALSRICKSTNETGTALKSELLVKENEIEEPSGTNYNVNCKTRDSVQPTEDRYKSPSPDYLETKEISYLRNTQDKYKHFRSDRDKEGTVEMKKGHTKGNKSYSSANYLLHKSQKTIDHFSRELSFSKECIRNPRKNDEAEDEEPLSQRVNTEIDIRRK